MGKYIRNYLKSIADKFNIFVIIFSSIIDIKFDKYIEKIIQYISILIAIKNISIKSVFMEFIFSLSYSISNIFSEIPK